ncbi:hypothetical protein HYFRA_00007834 [Hymenoscyphus fraxineus]|uniref:Uncharacterized protein n=1 Tax=Hymenoscyphus fraxineus TaxID=746836 RepID=A0A9N9KM80_9HELO|nr:hypothetical protein HYFRA_00007834 [Hymenoscyphus fraxineus]
MIFISSLFTPYVLFHGRLSVGISHGHRAKITETLNSTTQPYRTVLATDRRDIAHVSLPSGCYLYLVCTCMREIDFHVKAALLVHSVGQTSHHVLCPSVMVAPTKLGWKVRRSSFNIHLRRMSTSHQRVHVHKWLSESNVNCVEVLMRAQGLAWLAVVLGSQGSLTPSRLFCSAFRFAPHHGKFFGAVRLPIIKVQGAKLPFSHPHLPLRLRYVAMDGSIKTNSMFEKAVHLGIHLPSLLYPWHHSGHHEFLKVVVTQHPNSLMLLYLTKSWTTYRICTRKFHRQQSRV